MSNKISVLVVDDSAFARFKIIEYLNTDSEIEVIGTARDGFEALEKIEKFCPDVVTMDVEMPKMNGLIVLERIMETNPIPVVMLSSLTGEGAETTIKALELGAVDFYLKNSQLNPVNNEDQNNLITKIKNAYKINRQTLKLKKSILKKLPATKLLPDYSIQPKQPLTDCDAEILVIIASSTGGPRALYEMIPQIPADINASILIVQHMPPKFTTSMADRLNQLSKIEIKEAEEGDGIKNGRALLAPGGYHLQVKERGKVSLNKGVPVNGLRPAADVTIESAVEHYGAKCLGVILTGMGSDGTKGCEKIKGAGGRVITQDESTSVIFGMPRSVIERGLADKIVPLNAIVNEIIEQCQILRLSNSGANR